MMKSFENKEKWADFEKYKQSVVLDDCDKLETIKLSWYDYLPIVGFFTFVCFKFGFGYERIDRGLLRYNVMYATVLPILLGSFGLLILPWVIPFWVYKSTQKAIKKTRLESTQEKIN